MASCCRSNLSQPAVYTRRYVYISVGAPQLEASNRLACLLANNLFRQRAACECQQVDCEPSVLFRGYTTTERIFELAK